MVVSVGLRQPTAAQTGAAGLPPRPSPFQFVNDQGNLIAPADVKRLETGLRQYADKTGTQVVVVTVPSLGGREVADYGRALGESWAVGQREKNNGVVVLISKEERKVTIQPGSGLKDAITPAVTNKAIGQMTPSFKQGNYGAGLRQGLSTIMLAANPSSSPQNGQAASTAASDATPAANQSIQSGPGPTTEPGAVASNDPLVSPPSEPVSSGPGMGTILLGALAVGGIIWLLVKMLRGRRAAADATANPNANNAPNFRPNNPGPNANPNAAPNFLPNRPNGPGGNYGPGQPQGNYNQGYNNAPNQGGGGLMGGGMGGMLATGAAAAAGAYLGNRMASGHESSGTNFTGDGNSLGANTAAGLGGAGLAGAGLGGAAGAAGTGAAEDYFAGGTGADNSAPDYFADDVIDNSQTDFFSGSETGSYDDLNSDDTGGGGFDSGDDNSGSW